AYCHAVSRSKDLATPAERIDLPFVKTGYTDTARPVQINLTDDISLTCYCANGIIANGDVVGETNNIAVREKTKRGSAKDYSPNDLSLAFLLEWEGFRYFTAGDLSGASTSNYLNIESDLITHLDKNILRGNGVTVLKVSHHGSDHSNSDSMLAKLKADTIL